MNEISITIVSVVMLFTPVGVFCSIAGVVYANGSQTIAAIGGVLVALYITMFGYALIVYGGIVKLLGKCSVRKFFSAIMSIEFTLVYSVCGQICVQGWHVAWT